MEKQKHFLSDIWEKHPAIYTPQHSPESGHSLRMKEEIIAVGPFYYYTITYPDNALHNISEKILQIHGLEEYPASLHYIIELIHPDDIDFVIKAEDSVLKKTQEIGIQHLLNLENSYCFRMRVADGSYHLFHHKAVMLSLDSDGRLTSSLNIHTDIQHISPHNSCIVLVNGTGYRNDYHQICLAPDTPAKQLPLHLTRRERQVLALIIQGCSSQEISEKLFVSIQTVRLHRKNLLKKTQTTNSSALVRKSIEMGLI